MTEAQVWLIMADDNIINMDISHFIFISDYIVKYLKWALKNDYY